MEYKNIIYGIENGICTITLNRPDSYNSFNNEMSFELIDALKSATKDTQARVLVLGGSGKAFCSGQDLKDREPGKEIDFRESLDKRYNPIITLIRTMPKLYYVSCTVLQLAPGAHWHWLVI